MHLALGTDRNAIDNVVKRYATPMRHGNWAEAETKPLLLSNHFQMLRLTQDILVKYMNYQYFGQFSSSAIGDGSTVTKVLVLKG